MSQDAAAVATLKGNPGRANRAFIKLTITLCCDIVAGMQSRSLGAMNLSPAVMPLLRFLDFVPTKPAGNSERTADAAAVPASPNRRRPRISAEKEMSTADNFLQKQQKQREVPCAV
jgi:hypothetical protein